jgi:uncharacterized protein (TIGR03083 family)
MSVTRGIVEPSTLSVETLLSWIRENNRALVDLVDEDPGRAVPACPGLTVRDLLGHVGGFYGGWWTVNLQTPPDQGDLTGALAANPRPPTRETGWVDWFGEQADRFLAVAESVDLTTPTWTFAGPQPGIFWIRRVATETTVHRRDAEQALGHESLLLPARAAESVDDTIRAFFTLGAAMGLPRPDGPLMVHATGGGPRWLVEADDRTVTVNRTAGDGSPPVTTDQPGGTPRPAANLEGPGALLLMRLWNRLPATELPITGDAQVAQRWDDYISWLATL